MNLRAYVSQYGNPWIEGNTATLVWQGETAPHLLCDLNEWSSPRALRLLEPGLWAVSLELPEQAYLEYCFIDPQTGQRQRDPLNRKTVNNGVGGYNHFFYMPGGQPTPWARGPMRGKISKHTVAAQHLTISKERRVYLYHPPVDHPVPLLAVYDGPDYLKRGKLAQIVDHLITAKRIQPMALAFLSNAGNAGRMVEYGESGPTLAFLTERVLPLAKQQLPLLNQPGAHGILGSSMGGLMATFTALRLPEIFGKGFSQAGAFEWWGQKTMTIDLVRHLPVAPIRLWLDCGLLDSLLPCNRQMRDLLHEKGYTFGYQETPGAHNFTTWRNACAAGLEYLFG